MPSRGVLQDALCSRSARQRCGTSRARCVRMHRCRATSIVSAYKAAPSCGKCVSAAPAWLASSRQQKAMELKALLGLALRLPKRWNMQLKAYLFG